MLQRAPDKPFLLKIPTLILGLLLCITLVTSCSSKPLYFVSFNDPNLEYMGRMNRSDSTTVFYWPGSSVRMDFIGSDVQVMLKDEKGENYYYAIIDSTVITKIHTDTVKHLYKLASSLKYGKHSVQLFRLTEARSGKTFFYGFYLTTGDKVLKTPPKKRKIAFYGDSITSGYAADDTTGDSGKPEFFNNYYSYAAITARRFNAQYHCISKSGIGIMVSWFPIIMPEMYDRLDPEDSMSKWDFTQYTPDVVVINLLQNDAFLMSKPNHEQFKARFGTTAPAAPQIIESYKSFVSAIRGKYPDAYIICAFGDMSGAKPGEPWEGYIDSAVNRLHDAKVMTCFFPFNNTAKHPKRKQHLEMADILTAFINGHVKW